MLVYETVNFEVISADRPHVDRRDGGHIKIVPKTRVEDRTKLSPELAHELMMLTMLVGEAMAVGLNQRGIDVGRINYQENGNWRVSHPDGPYLHLHIYGRARSASIQKFGDALRLPHRETGFYDNFVPLNREDVDAIRREINRMLSEARFRTPPVPTAALFPTGASNTGGERLNQDA